MGGVLFFFFFFRFIDFTSTAEETFYTEMHQVVYVIISLKGQNGNILLLFHCLQLSNKK